VTVDRLRALTVATAVAGLLALACAKRPADKAGTAPSASASASAAPSASASASAAPSASASASAAAKAKPPPDPPPHGKAGGRLAPEVIQRVVRQHFGRFRLCYERNLRDCPNLSGRVNVKFFIDLDGSVKQPRNADSDMPDGETVACVVEAFRALQFPPPEGGYVTVTYPVMFSPGG
jgi:hypothetical protein